MTINLRKLVSATDEQRLDFLDRHDFSHNYGSKSFFSVLTQHVSCKSVREFADHGLWLEAINAYYPNYGEMTGFSSMAKEYVELCFSAGLEMDEHRARCVELLYKDENRAWDDFCQSITGSIDKELLNEYIREERERGQTAS